MNMETAMPRHCRIIIYILSVMLYLTGCGEKIQPGYQATSPAEPIRTPVAQADPTVHPVAFEAVGTVRARTMGIISSKLMGTVSAIHVREGDKVRSGQLLIEIDARMVWAQRQQAEAALAEARNRLDAALSGRNAAQSGAELARATYGRYVKLMKTDSASQQEFDEIHARHRQAEAGLIQAQAVADAALQRVKQAEAAVSAARVTDGDSRILAPYDGFITAKHIEPGNMATPGSPLLGIESSDGYRVDILLPENRIGSISPNQTIPVQIPSLDNLILTGTVDTIVPAADARSRSFEVQVLVPAHSGLASGLFARAIIPLTPVEGLWVPQSALIVQGQLTGMYQVDADKKARFRLVRTGRISGAEVEILSGLTKGVEYIKNPPPNLSDGMTVEGVS